jgi:hypothetical protein
MKLTGELIEIERMINMAMKINKYKISEIMFAEEITVKNTDITEMQLTNKAVINLVPFLMQMKG